MKPPISYFGGKSRTALAIAELLPEHSVYVEPYAGSAAVLFAKRPSRVEVLNDADGAVMAFFNALRDHPDELARLCQLTPYHRGEFAAAVDGLDDTTVDTLETARRFFTVVSQGFGSVPATRGWSRPEKRAKPTSETAKVDRLIERFDACATRLRQVHFEQQDALDVINRWDTPHTAFFIDPPYPASTASWYGPQRRKDVYRRDMHDDETHRELLARLLDLQGHIVVAGRDHDLYNSMLAEWKRVELGHVGDVVWVR